MPAKGYDVSDYQSSIPDDAAFVFVKASESRGTAGAKNYRAKLAEARGQGCVVGHYHFYSGNYSVDVQLANFRSVADVRPNELIALDFEPYGDYGGGQTDSQYNALKNEFLSKLKAAYPNNRVGLYCDVNWWSKVDSNAGDFLWIADYRTAGQPSIRSPWKFHQYTATPIDTDVYNGSVDDLRAWARVTSAPAPNPIPATAPAPVTITLPVNGYLAAPAWKAGDGNRVTFRGKTVNVRTRDMLLRAEALLGQQFTLFQGSYNAGGVAASAGTHDGGGVVDLGPYDYDAIRCLRRVGFAAWHRTPEQGFSHHCHAVAVGDREMSAAAAQQVTAFFNGRNGLAGNGPDDFRLNAADRVITIGSGEETHEMAVYGPVELPNGVIADDSAKSIPIVTGNSAICVSVNYVPPGERIKLRLDELNANGTVRQSNVIWDFVNGQWGFLNLLGPGTVVLQKLSHPDADVSAIVVVP